MVLLLLLISNRCCLLVVGVDVMFVVVLLGVLSCCRFSGRCSLKVFFRF